MSSNKTKVTLGVRCGSCVHFTGPKLFESKCKDLGISKNAISPNCYSPNISNARDIEHSVLLSIGKLVKDLDETQLQYLSFVFMNSSNLLETGLKFGQPVYVCLGEDYLSHYFSAYVTGVAYTGEHILLSSLLEDDSSNTTLMMYPYSILTKSQFAKKKDSLIKSGRLERRTGESHKYDLPLSVLIKEGKYVPKDNTLEDYIPPTLDTAPAAWLNKQDAEYDYKQGQEVSKQRKVIPIKKTIRSLDEIGSLLSQEDGSTTFSM